MLKWGKPVGHSWISVICAAFMTAAEHMNFTKAARQLFLTQSAVSYQISSLEKEVGVKLFERDPHLVRFTHPPPGSASTRGSRGF